MITHYDMSTGEVIGQDSRDTRADSALIVTPAVQPRLVTVEEAASIEQPLKAPAAVVMNALRSLATE